MKVNTLSPMQKYLFEYSFEDEPFLDGAQQETAAPVAEPSTEEVEEEKSVPRFTEEEMQAATQESFCNGLNQGVEEGRAQALGGIENDCQQALTAIGGQLPKLFAQIDKKLQGSQEQVKALVLTVLEKLFPTLDQSLAGEEVKKIVAECLARLPKEPKVILTLHASLLESLKPRIEALVRQSGFEGRLVFLSMLHGNLSDVTVEWGEGGAERNTESLKDNITALIEAALPSFERDSQGDDGQNTTQSTLAEPEQAVTEADNE